jgi:hypothetical protein
MKQTIFVAFVLLLCTSTVVAQSRRQMLQPRSDEHLPPRQLSQIDSVITKHQSVLETCYRDIKNSNSDFKGKLMVRLVISPEGSVKEATILDKTIASSKLGGCLIQKLKRLIFTRTSSKQGLQTVELPLNFADANED